MLEELNCKWSIVGHSERRQLLGESNDMIAEKLKLLYNKSLIKPIFCIGETLDEMKANKTQYILELQIESGMTDLNFNSGKDLLIAYEPVWAIGTGVSADIDTIYKNINIIKDFIKKFDTKNCNIYLLYGGSVNQDNASEIYSLNEVSGFLIGSISADTPVPIAHTGS
jgi:triosephosphate isomerase